MADIFEQLGEPNPNTQITLPEPEESHIQGNFQAQEAFELCRESLDFLAALALPLVYKYAFPPIYLALWGMLKEKLALVRDFSQLALGMPRGFAKTLIVKLLCLYIILFTSRKFILILGENQTKANNILNDVFTALEEPNIKTVFGCWNELKPEIDRQDTKMFTFRNRTITVMAGTVEVIRGISLNNERPDVMIFDDIQSRVAAESQVQSETLEREMTGTAMKAKSPHGCLFIFIANMYPTKWSLLRKLKQNPNWIKFIVGGILADGTSLWEELQPIAQLHREFLNDLSSGRPDIFFAEVLNDDSATARKLIDLSKLAPNNYEEGDIPQGKFIIIDPATGRTGGNAVAIGYCEMYDGKPALRAVTAKLYTPYQCIEIAMKWCFATGCTLVVVEGVAYQSTFAYWFNFFCQQRGVEGIACEPIYPGGGSKNSRILIALRQYAKGEIMVDVSCRAQVHSQVLDFNPQKTDNVDDILDLLTYMDKVPKEFSEQVAGGDIIQEQTVADVEVLSEEYTSSF